MARRGIKRKIKQDEEGERITRRKMRKEVKKEIKGKPKQEEKVERVTRRKIKGETKQEEKAERITRRKIKGETKQEEKAERVTRGKMKKEVKKEIKGEKKQEEKAERVTRGKMKKEVKKEIKGETKQEEEEVQIIDPQEEEEVQIIDQQEESEEEQVLDVRTAAHNVWMRVALKFASHALERGEVPVACLFTYGYDIICHGFNTVNETKNATRHAEMNCIDRVHSWAVARNIPYPEIFKEIKVIVTVEPCIMCAAAMMELQIGEIIYGCKNNRFGGCGSVFDVKSVYPNSECVIEGGLYADQAIALLKEFYKGENPNAPKSKAKKKRS